MLSAVSSFTHTKTLQKKEEEEAFSINTQTSEKLSMGKEHGLVFGAQSRNDIFVVMIHCRRMVNVILLHERNYTRKNCSKVNDRFWERNGKNTHTQNYA